jgi:hypothetical protein
MTALLDALARVFLAPPVADRRDRPRPVSAVLAPSAAVCGPGAVPLACALALALRRRGAALVCAWGHTGSAAGAPPTAAARRLAASMGARGIEARATGRLVVVTLAPDAATAADEAARAAAAAGQAPVVLALAGPREPDFDRVLAAQDLAVVAAQQTSDELKRLGIASLEDVTRRAVSAPALSAVAASAAYMGLCATPGARRTLAEALDALR